VRVQSVLLTAEPSPSSCVYSFFFFFFLLYFMYMDTLLSCMHVYHAWCPGRPEEGVRSSGTGITSGCQPPCRC
jgi:hypothetical protein